MVPPLNCPSSGRTDTRVRRRSADQLGFPRRRLEAMIVVSAQEQSLLC